MGDYIKSKHIVTRKPCRCWGCGFAIKKGEKALSITSRDMGKIFDSKYCNICAGILNKNPHDFEDGIFQGDIYEFALASGDEAMYCQPTPPSEFPEAGR